MILQELYNYYQRQPDNATAPKGFILQSIPFVIWISKEGRFLRINSTQEGSGKNITFKPYFLPSMSRNSSQVLPGLLWDHIGYLFAQSKKDPDRAQNQYKAWKEALNSLDLSLKGIASIKALCQFYSRDLAEIIKEIKAISPDQWNAVIKKDKTNVIFHIEGDEKPLPCSKFIYEYVLNKKDNRNKGRCLVTGNYAVIEPVHEKTSLNFDLTKIDKSCREEVRKCNTLVGFQKNSGYDSYNKKQGYNAPISKEVEENYTKALNQFLLKKNSKNKVQIGEMITLFWSEKQTKFEENFFAIWNPNKDDPDKGIQAVATLLKSPYTGAAVPESNMKFYILGLGPGGGSRIAVRYWHVGTVQEFAEKIKQHFLDLQIVDPVNRYDKAVDEKETHGSYVFDCLLRSIAVEGKIEKFPAKLAADTMRAIFTGYAYPATLLQQTVRRIRATQQVKRIQAAILKAYLNRKARLTNHNKEEITMSLDKKNINPGYRLGRLFAVLEKIQKDALPGINSTIRDRFYGAASSSPVTVFPQLLKLKNHHLNKFSNPAFKAKYEELIAEIINDFPGSMPTHFSMEDQARFAIGYYQQRQDLYSKAKETN